MINRCGPKITGNSVKLHLTEGGGLTPNVIQLLLNSFVDRKSSPMNYACQSSKKCSVILLVHVNELIDNICRGMGTSSICS